jgi:hypothetical protein
MQEWVHGPLGPDAVREKTAASLRTVITVTHSPAPAPCGPAGCRELPGDAP